MLGLYLKYKRTIRSCTCCVTEVWLALKGMGRGAGVLGRGTSKPKLENGAPVSEAGRAQNLKEACLLVVDAAALSVISQNEKIPRSSSPPAQATFQVSQQNFRTPVNADLRDLRLKAADCTSTQRLNPLFVTPRLCIKTGLFFLFQAATHRRKKHCERTKCHLPSKLQSISCVVMSLEYGSCIRLKV